MDPTTERFVVNRTKAELKGICELLGLPPTGTKFEMETRIRLHVESSPAAAQQLSDTISGYEEDPTPMSYLPLLRELRLEQKQEILDLFAITDMAPEDPGCDARLSNLLLQYDDVKRSCRFTYNWRPVRLAPEDEIVIPSIPVGEILGVSSIDQPPDYDQVANPDNEMLSFNHRTPPPTYEESTLIPFEETGSNFYGTNFEQRELHAQSILYATQQDLQAQDVWELQDEPAETELPGELERSFSEPEGEDRRRMLRDPILAPSSTLLLPPAPRTRISQMGPSRISPIPELPSSRPSSRSQVAPPSPSSRRRPPVPTVTSSQALTAVTSASAGAIPRRSRPTAVTTAFAVTSQPAATCDSRLVHSSTTGRTYTISSITNARSSAVVQPPLRATTSRMIVTPPQMSRQFANTGFASSPSSSPSSSTDSLVSRRGLPRGNATSSMASTRSVPPTPLPRRSRPNTPIQPQGFGAFGTPNRRRLLAPRVLPNQRQARAPLPVNQPPPVIPGRRRPVVPPPAQIPAPQLPIRQRQPVPQPQPIPINNPPQPQQQLPHQPPPYQQIPPVAPYPPNIYLPPPNPANPLNPLYLAQAVQPILAPILDHQANTLNDLVDRFHQITQIQAEPTIIAGTAPAAAFANACRKRKYFYDGNNKKFHLIDFIQKIERLLEQHSGMHPDELSAVIPELLRGQAKILYEASSHRFQSWDDIKATLRGRFMPRRSDKAILGEMSRRTMKTSEKIDQFVVAQRRIAENLSEPITERLFVEYLLDGLRGRYRKKIGRARIRSVDDLLRSGRELEEQDRWDKELDSPDRGIVVRGFDNDSSASSSSSTDNSRDHHSRDRNSSPNSPHRRSRERERRSSRPERSGRRFEDRRNSRRNNYSPERQRDDRRVHFNRNSAAGVQAEVPVRPAILPPLNYGDQCSRCYSTGHESRNCRRSQPSNNSRSREPRPVTPTQGLQCYLCGEENYTITNCPRQNQHNFILAQREQNRARPDYRNNRGQRAIEPPRTPSPRRHPHPPPAARLPEAAPPANVENRTPATGAHALNGIANLEERAAAQSISCGLLVNELPEVPEYYRNPLGPEDELDYDSDSDPDYESLDSRISLQFLNHDPRQRFQLPTSIAGYKFHALVDTGATDVLLNSRLKPFLRSKSIKICRTDKCAVLANGAFVPLDGVAYLTIFIGGRSWTGRALILDNLEHDIVLGMNIIQGMGAIIDFLHHTVTVHDYGGPMTLDMHYIDEPKAVGGDTEQGSLS